MMSEDGISSVGAFMEDPYRNPNNPNPNPSKRKRNLPGAPDPNSEVVSLSPNSLMATNRFVCEVCNKGFQREQNLQLHRRGHNLPWKLKQRTNKEVQKKKVYVCPEKTCVHNDPSRALGDLTGIKKHYSRKHGEKRWKCQKCSKKYAVLSDLKAHSKICGTREYKCDCGTIFSRKDSFITHRAFCDALSQQNARFISNPINALGGGMNALQNGSKPQFHVMFKTELEGLDSPNQLNLDMQKLPKFPMWIDDLNMGNHQRSCSTNSNNYLASTSASTMQELEQNQWYNRGVLLKEEMESTRGNFFDTAAELSQKPAQMVGNGFSLVNSFSNMGSFNSNLMSRNELFHQNLGKSDDLMNEFLTSSSSTQAAATLNTNGGDQTLWYNNDHHISSTTPLMSTTSRNFEYPSLLLTNGNEIGVGNSLTRDFLGVGGNQAVNRHNLLQENDAMMTKLASMDSQLNLQQYNTAEFIGVKNHLQRIN